MTLILVTAAITLGSVSLFIILFVQLHKKDHTKKLAKKRSFFDEVVWKNKLVINEQEEINDCIMAIDTINFLWLWLDFSGSKEETTLIDLWKLQSVKVDIEENSLYEQKKGKPVLVEKQITKIQLAVVLKDEMQARHIVFYQNYKHDPQNIKIIKQRAEYWRDNIQHCIKALPRSVKQEA